MFLDLVFIVCALLICLCYLKALFLVIRYWSRFMTTSFMLFITSIAIELFKDGGVALQSHIVANARCPWLMSFSTNAREGFAGIFTHSSWYDRFTHFAMWCYMELPILLISIITLLITLVAVPTAATVARAWAYSVYYYIRDKFNS